jgi:hypothetical protein
MLAFAELELVFGILEFMREEVAAMNARIASQPFPATG